MEEAVWQHAASKCPQSLARNDGPFFWVVQGPHNSIYHSDCQMSIRPHDSPHFGHIFVHFCCAKSSRMRFVFHTLTAIQKCFMPLKNMCPWYNMLSISSFELFLSLCCIFFKIDAKFDCVTLLEFSFFHFRNTSLVHTLTQLLSSWNLHWTSSRNVCLGWCQRRGYSVASCRATCSVSLLFRSALYVDNHNCHHYDFWNKKYLVIPLLLVCFNNTPDCFSSIVTS